MRCRGYHSGDGHDPSLLPFALALQNVTAPIPGVSFQNNGFVKAQGTKLVIGNKPFYGAGTNAYYAAMKGLMSENEVFYMMYEHARRGLTVMRIFAFNYFQSGGTMPDFGVYNEEAFERLDLVLAVAARNGIRLIMTLSNNWDFNGGTKKWVERGIGPNQPRELFFTDQGLRTKLKNYVRTLVTRTNTITGQKYVDDPTIMM